MPSCYAGFVRYRVAPFAGAWIEMFAGVRTSPVHLSLPSRERGLKFAVQAPIAALVCVAPFAGAWIEIAMVSRSVTLRPSLPSRERGLKSTAVDPETNDLYVAPFAGAWIEIDMGQLCPLHQTVSLPSRECGLKFSSVAASIVGYCRSLHGSVD